MLACMSDERVEEIIDKHGLPEQTPYTITDPDELRDELEDIQEEGVAFNNREAVKGVRSIAAPVLTGDSIVGAVCVSGPANRMVQERCDEEIKPLLLKATNEIELKLQYPGN